MPSFGLLGAAGLQALRGTDLLGTLGDHDDTCPRELPRRLRLGLGCREFGDALGGGADACRCRHVARIEQGVGRLELLQASGDLAETQGGQAVGHRVHALGEGRGGHGPPDLVDRQTAQLAPLHAEEPGEHGHVHQVHDVARDPQLTRERREEHAPVEVVGGDRGHECPDGRGILGCVQGDRPCGHVP